MPGLSEYGGAQDMQFTATGFFHTHYDGNRWWLVDPHGCAFLSLSLNHTDFTDPLHHRVLHIWERKYGSVENWVRNGVAKRFREWGFNTIGWTQNAVTKDARHGYQWSYEMFQEADLPYVYLLRPLEIEHWNYNPVFTDVFSSWFEEYCDYQARYACVRMRDDPKLIGYSLAAWPAWMGHPTGRWFADAPDPQSEDGKAHMLDIMRKYLDTMRSAIRRYDKNHMFLGDRLSTSGRRMEGLPDEIIQAAAEYVDVITVQFFGDPWEAQEPHFRRWHELTNKPLMNMDSERADNRKRIDLEKRGAAYVETIGSSLREPYMVGYHWCGFQDTDQRISGGFISMQDEVAACIGEVAECNHHLYGYVLNPV